ncbi:MAG: glycosyltransferase family 2 protein [Flavisolibacter sp.]
MKISVITPSYNQGQYLEQTIQSVINQNYDHLEYIVIDGGSDDNSVEIIKKYEAHLSYWESKKDKGQSEAINKGLKKSTGDILIWINSDDVLLTGALKTASELFQSLPSTAGVIHGGTLLFNEEKDLHTVYTYGKPSLEKYLSGMAFSQPSAFFKREYLERVGCLREDLHYGMDYDLFARLACVSQFYPVQTVFSKYRLHDESKSVAHSEKFRKDWDEVFLSICELLGWEDVKDQLSEFISVSHSNTHSFSFHPDPLIVGKANKQKTLFYFLSDILLHYYWYDEREKGRELLNKMKKAFPRGWFKEDERVSAVIQKLSIPEPILKGLKKLRGIGKG